MKLQIKPHLRSSPNQLLRDILQYAEKRMYKDATVLKKIKYYKCYYLL